jgi:hypothetical protein
MLLAFSAQVARLKTRRLNVIKPDDALATLSVREPAEPKLNSLHSMNDAIEIAK